MMENVGSISHFYTDIFSQLWSRCHRVHLIGCQHGENPVSCDTDLVSFILSTLTLTFILIFLPKRIFIFHEHFDMVIKYTSCYRLEKHFGFAMSTVAVLYEFEIVFKSEIDL